MISKDYKVISKYGLHAKIATTLVNEANKYDCDIFLEYDGIKIDLKSIMGLMSLGVPNNSKITIIVEGRDESLVLSALNEFILNENIAQVYEA